jgi:transposase-like protein
LKYVRRLKKKHLGYGDTSFIDEVFVQFHGKQHNLWRAVDQDDKFAAVFLRRRRDGKAVTRFFNRLLNVPPTLSSTAARKEHTVS